MLLGFYTGASGVLYNEQKLGVIANNLSNVNSTAFNKAYLIFRTRQENPGTKWIDPMVKERLPKTYGIQRQGVFPNFEPGSIRTTSNPFNLAISSELKNAFFAVRREGQEGKIYYTRNGTLSFAPEDVSNPNSPTILYLGGHQALNDQGETIQVDPSLGPVNITPDGTINQGGVPINELPIFRMNQAADPKIQQSAPLAAFQQKGDSLYEIPPLLQEQFNPLRIQAGDAGINVLMNQGSLQRSNVNVVNEYMEMLSTNRGAQANLSAMETQSSTLTKLFQMVRS